MKLSGIGGQAVIEGIMMRNKNRYSIAVRKPDNNIEVVVKSCKAASDRSSFAKLPIIRGIVNFVDALVIGVSTLTYSSSFYEDPKEQEPTKIDTVAKAVFREKLDSVIMAVTILLSVALAVGLFMVAPYYISRLLAKFIVQQWVLNLIEGCVRVLIFILYVLLISMMQDIKRTFMYHGAEHKCINCVEHGMALTVDNVRKCSREHKRCGTSFLFLVMFISVIFFIFIRLQNPVWQVLIRIVLVPVIAGVSYEVILWAGKSDSKAVMIVSKPGLWLQRLTTREPSDDMIQVAIKAVEAVFDWRTFLDDYYEGVPDEEIPEEAYYYEADDAYEEYQDAYEDEYEEAQEQPDEDGMMWDGSIEDETDEEAEYSPYDYYGEGDEEANEESEDISDEEPNNTENTEDSAAEADNKAAELDEEPEAAELDEEPEDADLEDDGFEIEDIDTEADDIGTEVPIFKQRNTDVGRHEKKRRKPLL